MASPTSGTQGEEIRTLMIEVARTQLAAVTAALKFWGGWVESANKYTQGISQELNRVSQAGADSREFVGRLTDLSREYLRNMISLPNLAVEHFTNEIEKISKPAAKPSRKARAKE